LSHHRAVRARRAALSLTFAVLLAAVIAPAAWAAAPSPKVYQNLPEAERSAAIKAYDSARLNLRAMGVDRIYPQFALDMAKYPRQGVAHRNVLVVLCKFPSEGGFPAQGPSSVSTPRYFYNHLFSDDPNDGITSLREYYRVNSNGRLVISGYVTSDWLEMPHSYGYYVNNYAGLNFGAYPRSAQKLAEDAMSAAYHDFDDNLKFFDNDGPDGVPSSGDDDGYVDAVMVLVPGAGGETSCSDPVGCQRLWAHESGIALYSDCPDVNAGANCLPGLPLGNLRGFVYNLGSEYNDFPGDNAVGTWIHEFSHTLGLPDLYDLTGGNGLGFYSLMAVGNYLPYSGDPNTTGPGVQGSNPSNLDAWSRQFLGFDNPVPATAGHYVLPPVTRGGGSIKIWSNGEPGTEYFIVENRTKEGSDASLPGEGLLVYHIDDTKMDNIDGPSNYRARIVAADNLGQLESGANYGDPGDFFPGTTGKSSITESTSPSTRDFSLFDTGIRITNIAYAADTVSFDLQIATKPELRTVRYMIDDAGGDGLPDPNEAEQLTLTVKNVGRPSGPLTLNLSTADPNVTLGITTTTAPPAAAGATVTTFSPFGYTIGAIGNLPHSIHFNVNWSDGTDTGAFGFDVVVGTQLGLSEDFESGNEPGLFWTHESLPGSSSDQWHQWQGAVRAKSGIYSAKLGSALALGTGSNENQSYAPMQDAALVSPTFELPAGSQLAFDSYIDAETYGGTESVDGGRVEISMNGGEWIPLDVDGGYGTIIKFDSSSSLRGQDVFSGSPQAWRHVTANLTGFSGEARVRFRFSSNEDNPPFGSLGEQIRPYEGWYVDNVVVQPRSVPAVIARKLSLRGGPSPYHIGAPSAGSIQFRFSAPDGLPHPELSPVVRVYDVRGRLVRELTSAPGLVASEFHATWDAKDRNGQTCRAGIYFASVDIQGKDQSFRMVLLK
jgi:M6 family metalloprotease-like protein